MKKYINFNYGYKENKNYKTRAELIKKLGFDGVFLYSQYNPEDYIRDVLDAGLEIGSLHLSYKKFDCNGQLVDKQYVNVIWQEPELSKEYLSILLGELEFAHKYCINTVVMHITGGTTPPPFSQYGVEFIRTILNKCKEYNITLCLENLRRLDYLIKVFEYIEDDSLKFCFDSGHANYMTNNVDTFPWDKFGNRLYYLHLNDNNTLHDQHFPPFYGNIKWHKVINRIFFFNRKIDLTLEVRNKDQFQDVPELEFLRTCMRSLKRLEKKIEIKEYALIDEYIKGYPNSMAYVERYLNDGSDSGFSVNSTYRSTSPKYGKRKFYLKNITINSEGKIIDFGDIDRYLPAGEICVHPDIFLSNSNNNNRQGVDVSPTASGRTLMHVENDDIFFLKVAYTRCLGRLTRHLGSDKIKSAVEVTNLLINAVQSGQVNSRFAFLREDKGRVILLNEKNLFVKNLSPAEYAEKDYEYGVIVREGKPYPYLDKKEYLIPFFSLFSKEYYPVTGELIDLSNSYEPLLIQLYKKQSKSMMDFVLEDIVYPLFNTYFDALIYAGVELEAHAQNMLLSVDENGHVLRIVCRDLESAGRDIPLMEYFHISNKEHVSYKRNELLPKQEGQKYAKYYITHSFMFDFKLGEYLVSKILKVAESYDVTFSMQIAQDKIKQFNKQFIDKLPDNFFPPDWCDYEKVNFEKTKKPRVYMWHDNPKYR